jgi:hypothetical protein
MEQAMGGKGGEQMQDVRLAYIAKQSMDNRQSSKAQRPVQHHLPALPFTNRDGDPHANTLPLLQQSLATPLKLARHATATTPIDKLQTSQTLVDDHDIDTQ